MAVGIGPQDEGDFFLIAEPQLPFGIGGVWDVVLEAVTRDLFADGIEGILEEFAHGDDGASVELLVGEQSEEAGGIGAEGSLSVFVVSVRRLDVASPRGRDADGAKCNFAVRPWQAAVAG